MIYPANFITLKFFNKKFKFLKENKKTKIYKNWYKSKYYNKFDLTKNVKNIACQILQIQEMNFYPTIKFYCNKQSYYIRDIKFIKNFKKIKNKKKKIFLKVIKINKKGIIAAKMMIKM